MRDPLRKERERDLRRKDREALKQLRANLKHAKRWRRNRLHAVRALCRSGLRRARESAAAIRARHREAAKREVDALRQQSRRECEARKRQAEEQSRDATARAQAKLEAELAHQRVLAIYTAKAIRPSATQARRALREALAESDSEVENNLDPELVPVWRKVKHRMRATPRRSRTETFAEWAAEHPQRVREILDAEVEASIAQLVRDEKKLRGRTLGSSYYGALSDAELARRLMMAPSAAAVPF